MRHHPKKRTAADQPNSHSIRVTFCDEQAQEVCIAGSFNDWRPLATPMVPMGHNRWVKELSLPPGRYEYKFVVDGKWLCDPAATENVPNPFGGSNSVLTVPPVGDPPKSKPNE